MNSATQATPPEDKRDDGAWMCLHKRFLLDAREQEPDVIFIGDFVVAMAAHTEMWEKLFAPMHCLNFGISEDQTQNVLWRIESGELDSTNPKVIVLSVGANNVQHSVDEIIAGIQACVRVINEKKPNASLVVLKLLPCGPHPNPMRSKVEGVNAKLKDALRQFSNTQIIDVDPGFVLPDGAISHHEMYDYLHLSRSAYAKSFEILADLLQQLLCESSVELSASTFE